jgi:hypothetical protein
MAPQDEDLTLMVRSAATPRVSNHEAAWYAFTISSRADLA